MLKNKIILLDKNKIDFYICNFLKFKNLHF